MRTSSMSVFKRHCSVFLTSVIMLFLIGCGGGSSGSSPSTPPPAPNPPPSISVTANAGSDRTVNAGDQVELKAGGTGNITGYSWSRVDGPGVTLTAVDLNAGWFTFIAPSTGSEASVSLTYRLTVTGAGGATAQDTVTFTIMRVNQAPNASAGVSQTVKGKDIVTLTGSGTDTDGSIASYLWEQVEGDSVVIDNVQSANASFTAPSTLEDITLRFRLTVTDNDGATDQAEVQIVVTPEDAPEISIHFPPVRGVVTDNVISAFGVAKAIGADVVSVTLRIGDSGPVTAVLGNNGQWHANSISIPDGADNIELEAEVIDSLGRRSKGTSVLQKSSYANAAHGSGPLWRTTKGLAIDPEANMAYVLTSGRVLGDVGIMPVELNSGIRGPVVSNWMDASQGTQLAPPSHMIYHREHNRFYVLSDHAEDVNGRALISVNPETGDRTVISGVDRGSGVNFEFAVAIAQGPGNSVFVSDNKAARVLQVDIQTGNRTVLVDQQTATHNLQGILALAWNNNPANSRLYAVINTTRGSILSLNLNSSPVSSSVLTSSVVVGQGVGSGPVIDSSASDVIYDSLNNRLVILTRSSDIIAVDLSTGNRQLLAGRVLPLAGIDRDKAMAFDADKQLVYVAGGFITGNLIVVNPRTGHKVIISQ